MKICSRCKIEKKLSCFSKHKIRKDGLRSECKECDRQRQKAVKLYELDTTLTERTCYNCKKTQDISQFCKSKHVLGGYGRECNECAIERRKRYAKNHARYARKKRYGISEEKYQSMLAEQNGKCLICKKKKSLVVDHSHNSGEIRALLCIKCNSGIGMFEENIGNISNAITYLLRFAIVGDERD